MTDAVAEPLGALLNIPKSNILVSTRLTIVSTVAWVTVPAATACIRKSA